MGALSNTNNPFLCKRDWPDGKAGVSLIDRLWNRLDGLYPGKFRACFPSQHQIDNWADAWADGFVRDGLTMAELAAGMEALRAGSDWPPSYPEFLKLCRRPVDLRERFFVAIEQMRNRRDRKTQRWPDNRTFWAAVRLGNDLLAQSYDQLAARWAVAWKEAADKADEEIPDVAPDAALPAPGKTTIPVEEAKRRIAAMAARLGAAKRIVVGNEPGAAA